MRHFTSRSYEWIVEGDIKACFDEISHPALMDRVRKRVGDKRVLALVKAFLKAGILCEDGTESDTDTGTPQGGILSPLANVALAVLDEHLHESWRPAGTMSTASLRWRRRLKGLPKYRMVRYADLCRRRHKSAYADFRVMPRGVLDCLVILAERGCRAGITRWVVGGTEVVEEREHGVRGSVASGGGGGPRDAVEGLFLEGQVGVKVDHGGFGSFVAEPERDDGGVDAGLQQRHRAGVAQRMRGDVPDGQGRAAAVCLATSRSTASRESGSSRRVGNSVVGIRRAR